MGAGVRLQWSRAKSFSFQAVFCAKRPFCVLEDGVRHLQCRVDGSEEAEEVQSPRGSHEHQQERERKVGLNW